VSRDLGPVVEDHVGEEALVALDQVAAHERRWEIHDRSVNFAMGDRAVRRRFPDVGLFARVETGMAPGKRALGEGWARVGPISVVCLMVLWGLAVIAPAALPH
jgi:hypothetical protein